MRGGQTTKASNTRVSPPPLLPVFDNLTICFWKCNWLQETCDHRKTQSCPETVFKSRTSFLRDQHPSGSLFQRKLTERDQRGSFQQDFLFDVAHKKWLSPPYYLFIFFCVPFPLRPPLFRLFGSSVGDVLAQQTERNRRNSGTGKQECPAATSYSEPAVAQGIDILRVCLPLRDAYQRYEYVCEKTGIREVLCFFFWTICCNHPCGLFHSFVFSCRNFNRSAKIVRLTPTGMVFMLLFLYFDVTTCGVSAVDQN